MLMKQSDIKCKKQLSQKLSSVLDDVGSAIRMLNIDYFFKFSVRQVCFSKKMYNFAA